MTLDICSVIKFNSMETSISEQNVLRESEFNRFGLISMILLVVGCVGGVAVGLGAIKYVSVSGCTYDGYLKFIVGSCSNEMDLERSNCKYFN